MEEIDLIIPQGAFLKSKARALKKEKKQRYKTIFQYSVLAILTLILLTSLIISDMRLKKKGIQGCLENGYSYSYCIEHS